MQSPILFEEKLVEAVSYLRKNYSDFEDAYSSYVGQYGEGAVGIHEPFEISGTIDPVVIVLGRTTPLFYRDSQRTLIGSLSSTRIEPGLMYIIGRREPLDSKLMVWSKNSETEVEHFDSRIRIVPSRVHAALMGAENGDVLFDDLGSSSGSILAGETDKPEPFITLYATPRVGVHRVELKAKYSPSRAK